MTESILLTAAVRPTTNIRVALADHKERRDQYLRAVTGWSRFADQAGLHLAIAETSGAEREEVIPAHVDQVEFFSYQPSPELADRGKGALEADTIDYVMNSWARIDPDRTVHKLTGRLLLANAGKVLKTVGSNSVRVRRTLDRAYCDTRVVTVRVQQWQENYSGMAAEVDDANGRYLEHTLAHRLINAEYSSGLTVEQFAERPSFVGMSGSSGRQYAAGPSVLRSLAVRIESKVLPRAASKQR